MINKEGLLDDRNAPANKGDILDLDTKIEQLRTEVNHGYGDLAERMDDSSTKLLNAFYSVAETYGKRLAELDSNEYAIRSRLSTVDNRVMELEKRIITPPPSA
jgi:predicted  nucleic acid-binding Zn-ribbon protein